MFYGHFLRRFQAQPAEAQARIYSLVTASCDIKAEFAIL
jgi:hypothetical protein